MIRSDVHHARIALHEFDLSALAAAEAENGLHLSAFMASVARLQERERGNLRNYLADLLHQGWFEIVSPETGTTIRSGASLLLVDQTVLFSFPAEPTLLLSIGDLSLGHPISALILTQRALILEVVHTDWGFAARHLEAAARVMASSGWTPGPATGPLTLVLGDSNFAHHAWNQLSTLAELPFHALAGRDIGMIATHQPLGPIQQIVPETGAWPLLSKVDTDLEGLNTQGTLFAPVGGSRIRAELVDRILAVARSRMSADCRTILDALAQTPGPVLWLSVRTRNRTAVNQHDLLVALGSTFLRAAPEGVVVIDGHSIPDDLARQPPFASAEISRTAARDRAAALAVADALNVLVPEAPVHLAVGLTICDSIILARQASFYVCHHGTVQHKIGWFSGTPGLIHCNRVVLASNPAHWVATQSDIASEPKYLLEGMVEDRELDTASSREFDHLLNLGNYEITDIPAVVRLLLSHATANGVALTPDQEDTMRLNHLIRGATQDRTPPAPPPPSPAPPPASSTAPVSRPPDRHLLSNPQSLVPTGTLYTDFFHFLDANLHPRSYFEIGTHLGRSVKAFTCSAVCVDPHFMLDQDVLTGRPQTHFFQMPSDTFFAEHDLRTIFNRGPDICFLDGMHRSEYLLRDFANIERLCHRRSIVFLHDCLPVNARMALRTHEAGDPSEGHWQHAWTGDVWKMVPLLAKHRPDLKIFYLDCAPTGLVAITNLDPESSLLSTRYSDLVDELRGLDLETYTIQRLWSDHPVISSRSLVEHPEDLTLYLTIA